MQKEDIFQACNAEVSRPLRRVYSRSPPLPSKSTCLHVKVLPLDVITVIKRISTTHGRRPILLPHKRHAVLRALLLRRRPRQRRRLDPRGNALLLPALAAAEEGQQADTQDNSRGKDDGNDDAADVDAVVQAHANGATAVVDGAGVVGQAGGRGGLEVRAGEGGGLAVYGLHGAVCRGDEVKLEAVVAVEGVAGKDGGFRAGRG